MLGQVQPEELQLINKQVANRIIQNNSNSYLNNSNVVKTAN